MKFLQTSLAVGDAREIINEAELVQFTLQVQYALNIARCYNNVGSLCDICHIT